MSERMPNMEANMEDDNHTIADMSGIRRQRLVVPRLREGLVGRPSPELGPQASERSFSDELQSDEERWMVILGTLKAGLAIGMVYIVAFGIAIALMLWAWT